MTTDEGMKFAFIIAAIEESPYWDPMTKETAEATWDEWIARVRRDAAREALDGLADQFNNWAEATAEESARTWRDTHYPEEAP